MKRALGAEDYYRIEKEGCAGDISIIGCKWEFAL